MRLSLAVAVLVLIATVTVLPPSAQTEDGTPAAGHLGSGGSSQQVGMARTGQSGTPALPDGAEPNLSISAQGVNSDATGAPSIQGILQKGKTLKADTVGIADDDGIPENAFSYQWVRVETDNTEADISGATSSEYKLAADDVGKTIKLRVTFEDSASNAESLTSAATPVVVDEGATDRLVWVATATPIELITSQVSRQARSTWIRFTRTRCMDVPRFNP